MWSYIQGKSILHQILFGVFTAKSAKEYRKRRKELECFLSAKSAKENRKRRKELGWFFYRKRRKELECFFYIANDAMFLLTIAN